MHTLQALGEALVELPENRLASLDLPERLADAIAAAKRIRGFEAKRRQMQYIGRLMRDTDPAPIAAYLERLRSERRRGNTEHQQLERWRERLLAEDSALTELAAISPGMDLQQMRTLIRNARNEQARGQPPKATRALFRMLRSALTQEDAPSDGDDAPSDGADDA